MVPGSNGWDVAGGVIGGGFAGVVSGLWSGGIGGAVAGAAGDFIGQAYANYQNGKPLKCVNWGEVVGAGIGGFAGGVMAGKMMASGISVVEAGWAGAGVATVSAAIGNWANGNDEQCGCKQ